MRGEAVQPRQTHKAILISTTDVGTNSLNSAEVLYNDHTNQTMDC